jgi:hypothetical protein
MFQRTAHRLGGDPDQSAERMVQFEEQENRDAHGQGRRMSAVIAVPLRGVKRPKLRKMIASQNTTTIKSDVEMEVPACWKRSQYIWPISTVLCKAGAFAARCASVCGEIF